MYKKELAKHFGRFLKNLIIILLTLGEAFLIGQACHQKLLSNPVVPLLIVFALILANYFIVRKVLALAAIYRSKRGR